MTSEAVDRVEVVVAPLLIDVTEVARRLGIGQSTVYRWDALGRLGPQAIKLGGRRLWRVEEVERWVEARCPNREKWRDMEKRRR